MASVTRDIFNADVPFTKFRTKLYFILLTMTREHVTRNTIPNGNIIWIIALQTKYLFRANMEQQLWHPSESPISIGTSGFLLDCRKIICRLRISKHNPSEQQTEREVNGSLTYSQERSILTSFGPKFKLLMAKKANFFCILPHSFFFCIEQTF